MGKTGPTTPITPPFGVAQKRIHRPFACATGVSGRIFPSMRIRIVLLAAMVASGCAGALAKRADDEGQRLLLAQKRCDPIPLGAALTECILALPAGDPVVHFQRAVDLAPGVGVYHYHLAQAYGRAHKRREALAELRAAATTNPPYAPAVEYLAGRERELIAEEVANAMEDRLRAH